MASNSWVSPSPLWWLPLRVSMEHPQREIKARSTRWRVHMPIYVRLQQLASARGSLELDGRPAPGGQRATRDRPQCEPQRRQHVPDRGRLQGPAPKGKAPSFAVYAVKDPDSGNLDRIQMVKCFFKHAQTFEKIYDIAWAGDRKPDPVTGKVPPIGSTVDIMQSSYTNTIGAAELKAVWTDPDF